MSATSQSVHDASLWVAHEIDLGDRLNRAVSDARRADFSWWLSLLSRDATESAFARLQPSSGAEDLPWQPPGYIAEGVARKRPLAPQGEQWRQAGSDLVEKSLTAWYLADCLTPQALTNRDDATYIPGVIRDNCTGYVRARWQSTESSAEPDSSSLHGSPADLVDIIDQLRGGNRATAP